MLALVLGRMVVPLLALRAGEDDLVTGHGALPDSQAGAPDRGQPLYYADAAGKFPDRPDQARGSHHATRPRARGSTRCYARISVTTPAPTVRPPSRIAKRSSRSIAIGVISSISICTLSPGITISTPSGSVTEPVTSVVRK